MARASNPTVDPALDAAALLRRVGFFGLFVVVPVVAQVSRRASVVIAPIAVVLLIIASAIDGRQRPLRPASLRLLRSPAFLAGMLAIFWAALSLAWTPFLGSAAERFANLAAVIALTVAGYLALPDRMRSANLYLLPLGVAAGAIVAIVLGLFGNSLMRGSLDDDTTLDRGLTLLALLVWPAVAWLRSRRRDREALAVALVTAGALAVAPNITQILAIAAGAIAFAVAVFRPALGAALTAAVMAGLLAIAPLLPFVARPLGAALLGRQEPVVVALKAWETIVLSEPLRLITGHGLRTASRGRVVGLLPADAPTTALFELWYELGVVGALAAAFALYASIRRAGRDGPALVPSAMAVSATAFAFMCLGVGLTTVWWLTAVGMTVLVFVAIERGQFRTRRPKVSRLSALRGDGTA